MNVSAFILSFITCQHLERKMARYKQESLTAPFSNNIPSASSIPATKQANVLATKIVATSIGIALCSVEVWLNAESVAKVEGWQSSLIPAVIIASISAAAAIPLSERAILSGQWLKSLGLTAFFLLMVTFSFTTSVSRTGEKQDNATNSARGDNTKIILLREGYEANKKTAEAECAKNVTGSKCRNAENMVKQSRDALAARPVERIENSMALRISSALPFITSAQVELYQPLVLPLGLQLGGFLMLALGLSPHRQNVTVGVTPSVTKTERKPRKKKAPKSNAERQREYRER